MTVIVTTMPGGIAQVINPEAGRITYKCKSDSAVMEMDAFGGVVRFLKKGSKAIVAGEVTRLEDCAVVRPGDPDYESARDDARRAAVEFHRQKIAKLDEEIQNLES